MCVVPCVCDWHVATSADVTCQIQIVFVSGVLYLLFSPIDVLKPGSVPERGGALSRRRHDVRSERDRGAECTPGEF